MIRFRRPQGERPKRNPVFTWLFSLGMAGYIIASILSWFQVQAGWLFILSIILLIITLPWALFPLFRLMWKKILFRVRNRIIVSYLLSGIIPIIFILIIALTTIYLFLTNISSFIYENELVNLGYRLNSVSAQLSEVIYNHPDEVSASENLHEYFQEILTQQAPDLPDLHVFFYRLKDDRTMEHIAVESSFAWDSFQSEHLPDWLQKVPFTGTIIKNYSVFLLNHRILQVGGEPYYLDIYIPFRDGLFEYLLGKADFQSRVTIEETILDRDNQRIVSYAPFNGFRGPQPAQLGSERPSASLLARNAGGGYSITASNPIAATDWFTREHAGPESTSRTVVAHFRIPMKSIFDYLSSRTSTGKILFNAIVFFIIVFLVVEAVLFVIGILIIRSVTRPIAQLSRGTQELRKGNFQVDIPHRGQDEMSALIQSFNVMSRSIRGLLLELADKQRIQRELEIARQVQNEFFPKSIPSGPGFSLAGSCLPAREVSGDFYDFIQRSDQVFDIIVGDISGKGISAALLMASLLTACRAQPQLGDCLTDSAAGEAQIQRFMETLNHHVYEVTPPEKFATLFYLRFFAKTGALLYCNAGQEPPVLIRPDGSVDRLETGGVVFGLFTDSEFQVGQAAMGPGDTLAIYTDGLIEAISLQGEDFGDDKVIQTLKQMPDSTASELHEAVTDEVLQWFTGMPQHDDITLVILKRKPSLRLE